MLIRDGSGLGLDEQEVEEPECSLEPMEDVKSEGYYFHFRSHQCP